LINPPKTILASVDFGSTTVSRTYNNPSSIWNGYPYEFTVDITIIPQFTSDDLSTPDAYQYNAYNVSVGDWLGQQNGLCYLVTEIVSVSSSTSMQVVIQDVDLYNLLLDPNGVGSNYPQETVYGVFFDLGDDGTPVIDPTELQRGQFGNVSYWLNDLYGRFTYRNNVEDYYSNLPVGSTGYTGFSIGDFVYLNQNSRFVQANSSSASETAKIFGAVTSVDVPEQGNLTVRPFGRVLSGLPLLPGATGDLLYFDSGATATNQLTATKPTSNIFPTYIKISSNIGLLLTSHSDLAGGTGTGSPVAIYGPTGQVSTGATGIEFIGSGVQSVTSVGDFVTVTITGGTGSGTSGTSGTSGINGATGADGTSGTSGTGNKWNQWSNRSRWNLWDKRNRRSNRSNRIRRNLWNKWNRWSYRSSWGNWSRWNFWN
jgi:hypothetical protein